MAQSEPTDIYVPALQKPTSLLPITRHRENLLYLVETFPVTIVVGHTGSGKTTQIPQYLEQSGWCSNGKIVAVTQPRRVAATSVAIRVAEEMRCKLGEQVGYSIRFEDVTSAATRIKYLTDGLLLREALVDPLLSRYSVIMVDEAHERSVSTDVLLGVLRKILRRRDDLRIVISSATLQADRFLEFFSTEEQSNAGKQQLVEEKDETATGRIISLEGRMYPVDVLYAEDHVEDYVEKAIEAVFDIHKNEEDGDILLFLTGRDEIEYVSTAITEQASLLRPQENSILPIPLYSGLSADQQMWAFEPAPEATRKVILSTNIAEASLTIDGIVYVIDCGYVKLRTFDPLTGIENLTATAVSKASATQRAGRAGRTKPGKCFRLYTESTYGQLEDSNAPEIQRSNLAPIVLQLKALGIDNIVRFGFLTPPPAQLLIRAMELLFALGALDEYAKLTKPLGSRMADLAAVKPMMAKCLLSASSFGCLSEMLTIGAMTSAGSGSVWFNADNEKKMMESSRRKFAVDEGDHLTLLNIYQAFSTKGPREAKFCKENHLNFQTLSRATSIRAQLKRYLERFGIVEEETPSARLKQASAAPEKTDVAQQIRKCLTAGFFAHAAKMQPDGTFRNVAGGTIMHAHPSSLIFNRKAGWVIFDEAVETAGKTFIRDVTKIEKAWLSEYGGGYYQAQD